MDAIYLDAHATTPCDPRVVDALLPTLARQFGNPHSAAHAFGWAAEALVAQARGRVAALLGAEPAEIVFTAGATESNNLALRGVAAAYAPKGRHLISTAIEHSAVLEVLLALEREGFEVTRLVPPPDGVLRAGQVEAALRPETILVSVMAANNEVGTLQPLAELGALCKARGVLFHTDAAQAAAHLPLDVQALGVDLLSLSAHKFYGPKGSGALYVRRRGPRVRLAPLLAGGGQEGGLRPGTLNVPGIVGLGRAAELVQSERESDAARLAALRDALWTRLQAALPGLALNGSATRRLPNNLNFSVAGVDAESLLASLAKPGAAGPALAVSSGSACVSSTLRPSHVLLALGVPEPLARAALRLGLHRGTTEAETTAAAEKIIATVRELREHSLLWGNDE